MKRALPVVLVVALAASLVVMATPAAAVSSRVYTYEVRGRENTISLKRFARLAAQTLRDPKGWALGGNITFRRVSRGADFTLWLAAASSVPSFGPPCDSAYSCRVGRNVVINQSRWLHATPSWNNARGSLRNYRHMVINHEVGHWLGFGHAYCGGAGRAAPVMQQQSISLQGCHFNAWPTAGERKSLSSRKHVPVNHAPIGTLLAAKRTAAGLVVTGWTIDPDTIRRPVVHLYVDGKYVGKARADRRRDSLGALYPRWGPLHGFRAVLPIGRPGNHRVCAHVLNVPKTPGAHSRLLGCRTFR